MRLGTNCVGKYPVVVTFPPNHPPVVGVGVVIDPLYDITGVDGVELKDGHLFKFHAYILPC
jgi:hypothetical protein